MNKSKKIYIAGHGGMVGSAIYRNLTANKYFNIITKGSAELDLRKQSDVNEFFSAEKPDIIIVAAAKVGGILANDTFRAEFLYDNLMIEANIINAAHKYRAGKLLFLGSSCIYPKMAAQPIKEEELLSGYLESTNEPYAIAKIAGLKLCESYFKQYGSNFFSIMPCNLYGPYDNFDLRSSHVLPAFIRKFHSAVKDKHEARQLENSKDFKNTVTVWGSGKPEREFLYVDDLADAVRFVLENVEAKDLYSLGISHLNVGSGMDVTIKWLAEKVADVSGYKGEITFDNSKPDGTPKKLMDSSRIKTLGWKSKTSLDEGIKLTYDWFNEYSSFYENNAVKIK